MKILIYSLVAISLIGCSNITFDGLQYDRYVSLVEDSAKLKEMCDEPGFRKHLDELKADANHMQMYASFRSNSPEVLSSTNHLSGMVDELYTKYQTGNPSKAYCVEKLDMISAGAKTVAATLGAQ